MEFLKKLIIDIQKRFIIAFAIFWVTLQIIFVLFTFLGLNNILYDELPLRLIFGSFTPREFNNSDLEIYIRQLFPLYIIFSLLTAIFGTLLVSKGRVIEEALGIFIGFAIPKRKKLTGKVFNVSTGGNIPFVKVNILDIEDRLITSVISDLDGRYRINLENPRNKYYIFVNSEGFIPYKDLLTNVYNNNVIQDIPLKSTENISNSLRSFYFHYIKPKLYIYFSFFLLFFSTVPFLSTLYYLPLFGLSIYSLLYILIYGISTIWNLTVIYDRISFRTGKIIDSETKKSIESAIMSVYKDGDQVQSVTSNNQGIVRINLPEGIYSVKVSKKGYLMVNKANEEIEFFDIYITKDGVLNHNLYLKKIEGYTDDKTKLFNPFQ